jgi:hypothetical protein
MTQQLREELDALAHTQSFSPDPSAWDRGRRARRRDRALAVVAAVLVVLASVGGGVALWSPSAREARTASTVVPEGGAIPSRISPADIQFGTWPPRGRTSVAYLSSGGFVLVDAEDGTYQLFGVDDPSLALTRRSVLALSPDGWRLAWTTRDRIVIADLESGEITPFAHNGGRGADVGVLGWRPDSRTLLWNGRDDVGLATAGLIDTTGPTESSGGGVGRYGSRGAMSPSGDSIALPSDGEVSAAAFLHVPDPGRSSGEAVDRPLPADLYPDGAVVTPVGWADEDHVVAIIDPPPSDITEHPRLVVLTSPDVPEAEWTWREFLPRLPPEESLGFAVDLIPDLTGDPDQELTHDFGDTVDDPPTPLGIELSLFIGLAVAAAIALLLGLRLLWRRLA